MRGRFDSVPLAVLSVLLLPGCASGEVVTSESSSDGVVASESEVPAPTTTDLEEVGVIPFAGACANIAVALDSLDINGYVDYRETDWSSVEVGGEPDIEAPNCALLISPTAPDTGVYPTTMAIYYGEDQAQSEGLRAAFLAALYDEYDGGVSYVRSIAIDGVQWQAIFGGLAEKIETVAPDVLSQVGGEALTVIINKPGTSS
jgi:hypothetical protein